MVHQINQQMHGMVESLNKKEFNHDQDMRYSVNCYCVPMASMITKSNFNSSR